MISAITPAQIEALTSLEHNSHFIAVIEWLEESLQRSLYELTHNHDEVVVRRAQGSVMDLSEILDTAKNARTIIERSKR